MDTSHSDGSLSEWKPCYAQRKSDTYRFCCLPACCQITEFIRHINSKEEWRENLSFESVFVALFYSLVLKSTRGVLCVKALRKRSLRKASQAFMRPDPPQMSHCTLPGVAIQKVHGTNWPLGPSDTRAEPPHRGQFIFPSLPFGQSIEFKHHDVFYRVRSQAF